MIATSLERLGQLAGSEATAQAAAAAFRARWQQLEAQYRGRAPVSVFYQIWSQPLMTLNGQHMVSSVLRLSVRYGGRADVVMEHTATFMRDREEAQRELMALSAETRLSAWVLGLLPPLFMVYLLLTNYDYVSVMFTEPLGIVMMVGAALWLAVGVFWMSRLGKVEV